MRLDGLEPVHGQVLHDADDDDVLVLLAPGQALVATDDDAAGAAGAAHGVHVPHRAVGR